MGAAHNVVKDRKGRFSIKVVIWGGGAGGERHFSLYSTELRLFRMDITCFKNIFTNLESFASFSNIQKVLWDDIVRNQVVSLKFSIIAFQG